MINLTNHSKWLDEELRNSGYEVRLLGDAYVFNNGSVIDSVSKLAIQAINDSFVNLTFAQKESISLVKNSTERARARYVTGGAGKDAEYGFKIQEALQFNIDATIGVFMQARIDKTLETAQVIADEWNSKSQQWQVIGANIAAEEDKAIKLIKAETVWQNCAVIANDAIKIIDAM